MTAQSIQPILRRNDQSAELETFWLPDDTFGYERMPARYYRTEARDSDIWSLETPENTGDWRVLPEAKVEIIQTEPNRIRFRLRDSITDPTHLAVVSGSDRLLYLLLDPPDYLPMPEKAIDVTTLGITPDTGKLLSTEINEELKKLSASGGGTLYFPQGIYDISTIIMQNGTFLHLAKGAVLKATFNLDDYPLDPPGTEFEDLPRSLRPGHKRRLVLFEHVKNAGIHGQGAIDAQGSEMRRRHEKPRAFLNHIRLVGCENISVRGIILRDSEFWSTHVLLSQNITFDGVKVINEIPPIGWDRYRHPESNSKWNNADGINPDSSQNVSILNGFFHTGDDCVPVKNSACYKGKLRDVNNIQVRSAMMVSSVTAMKLGTETLGEQMDNILFEDIEVVYASRVISTDLKDGLTASNITYRDIRVHQCNRPFDFWIIPREDHPDQKRFSNLQNVRLENVVIAQYGVEKNGGETSHLKGRDAEHTVKDITFLNVVIEGRPMRDLSYPIIKSNEFIENIHFE